MEQKSMNYQNGAKQDQEERVIYSGKANYFTGKVSAGGNLQLTNQRLTFQAHSINIGRTEAIIDLKSVSRVSLVKNLIISQHIMVETNDGEEHRFVVYHGDEWVKKISRAVNEVIRNVN